MIGKPEDNERCVNELCKRFKLRNHGPVKSFLGLNVTYENGGIRLNQIGYIHRKAQEFGLTNSKPCDTPLDPSLGLSFSQNRTTNSSTRHHTRSSPDLSITSLLHRALISPLQSLKFVNSTANRQQRISRQQGGFYVTQFTHAICRADSLASTLGLDGKFVAIAD
jgi:hypothetical protein